MRFGTEKADQRKKRTRIFSALRLCRSLEFTKETSSGHSGFRLVEPRPRLDRSGWGEGGRQVEGGF